MRSSNNKKYTGDKFTIFKNFNERLMFNYRCLAIR